MNSIKRRGEFGIKEIVALVFIILFIIFTYIIFRRALEGVFGK